MTQEVSMSDQRCQCSQAIHNCFGCVAGVEPSWNAAAHYMTVSENKLKNEIVVLRAKLKIAREVLEKISTKAMKKNNHVIMVWADEALLAIRGEEK